MDMNHPIVTAIVATALAAIAAPAAAADKAQLPALKQQPTVQKVIDEHLAALNKCHWNRLMRSTPTTSRSICPTARW